jgi:hypothetical protein
MYATVRYTVAVHERCSFLLPGGRTREVALHAAKLAWRRGRMATTGAVRRGGRLRHAVHVLLRLLRPVGSTVRHYELATKGSQDSEDLAEIVYSLTLVIACFS